ncbi:hypothetical protein VBI05_07645 [Enterococcus avium]
MSVSIIEEIKINLVNYLIRWKKANCQCSGGFDRPSFVYHHSASNAE